ncbi:unnamed protein product, partial [marine sediment metagenome]
MSLIGQDGNIVLAATTDWDYDFDSTTATQQVISSESGFFTTWNSSDNTDMHVDTTHKRSNDKSYRVNRDSGSTGYMYLNSTIDTDSNFIVNTSFWIYFEDGDTLDQHVMSFEMYDKDDILLWQFYVFGNVSALKLKYYDHNG